MIKSSTMLEYERLTGEPSTRTVTDGIHLYGIEVWHYKYVNWLELHKALIGDHVEPIGQDCVGNCSNCFLSCLNRGNTGMGFVANYDN